MPALSALPHPQRGAPPPAFGSPRDIFRQKMNLIFCHFLSPNIPGVRGLAPGSASQGPAA